MSNQETKRRIATAFQKRFANPIRRRIPAQELLETTGRKSGEPRVTPVGGLKEDNTYWFVSEFGEKSQYVRNIQANNKVRVRLGKKWYTGTAHLLHDDDTQERLKKLPKANSAGVVFFGTDLLTVRVDLD